MAEQRYIRTDSTAGGDGTEDRTDGSTRAYATLGEWQTEEAKDITGIAGGHIVTCSAPTGVADAGQVYIGTWVTDATHPVRIESAVGDEALKTGWDTSRYRIESTDQQFGTLRFVADNIHLVGLQIGASVTADNNGCGVYIASQESGNDNYIQNCIIKAVSIAGTGSCYGIRTVDADANVRIENTIVTGFISGSDSGFMGIYCQTAGVIGVYNTIVTNCYRGVNVSTGTVTCTNCAVFNNTHDFTGTITITNCASDDADGTNPIAPSGSDWDNEYLDSTNGDFTLLATGNCYLGGTPVSGINLDMEDDTYNVTTPSVGVDEYVGAPPASGIIIFRRRIEGE